MGTMFPEELVKELFSTVKGRSSIAKLSGQEPIAFTGNEYFTFSFDREVAIVGEGEAKGIGGITVEPVTVKPLKVEYSARVSDEFMYAAEDKQLDILSAFTDGYSKKIARALDIMAFHGMDPRSAAASALIGANSLDTNTGVNSVIFDATDPEGNIEDAITALGDNEVNGFAFSKEMGVALANVKVNNQSQYPEFKFGGNPGAFAGHACDVNSTVAFDNNGRTYLGDFQNAFKWGFAKEIPVEVIPYGDPDGQGKDLKRYNQVLLRAETFIGWGILLPGAFSRIVVQ